MIRWSFESFFSLSVQFPCISQVRNLEGKRKYRGVNGRESEFSTWDFFLRFGGILHGRISLNAEVARQEAAANQQIEPAEFFVSLWLWGLLDEDSKSYSSFPARWIAREKVWASSEQTYLQSCFRTSLFSEEQAQRLIDEHNYYRRFQNASDMELMVWDQDLGRKYKVRKLT